MHSGPGDCQKEEKPKIYDGSICFKKFVAAMGTILGEFELAKALWRLFIYLFCPIIYFVEDLTENEMTS
jgi:hypothetical protein